MYIAQIMTLTEQDWNHVFAPVIKLVKNWMKLLKNTPSSLIFHEGCLGMNHPWKIFYINTIIDLTIRLNSDSHAAISTHIRLRDAQLKSLITDLIFDCDLNVMPWIKLQTRKNVSFNALVRAPDELSQLGPSHESSRIESSRVGKILACNHELSHGPSHGSSHGSYLTRFINLRVRLAKEVKEKQ
ncbi:hypothetical protein RhiirB3_459944 [Rhizophagus irregularis]|nr:hypothetical protein RhiirB3_459944 [Rhizophagus irregularis]